MRRTLFTEHQLISLINLMDSGKTMKEIFFEVGISEKIYFKLESRYDGVGQCNIAVRAELEIKNARLQKTLDDLAIENQALKNVIRKIIKLEQHPQ